MVSDKITDEAGSPLPGVNIIEKGTTNGTVSDTNGNYKITVVSGESVIVFSFLGFLSQQIAVGALAEVNIQLLADAATL